MSRRSGQGVRTITTTHKLSKYFSRIRDLVFAEKFKEAEKIVDDHFYGIPKSQEAYQPIGDLILSFPDTNVTDYRRELDMETGVAKISYRQGDASIHTSGIRFLARPGSCRSYQFR